MFKELSAEKKYNYVYMSLFNETITNVKAVKQYLCNAKFVSSDFNEIFACHVRGRNVNDRNTR